MIFRMLTLPFSESCLLAGNLMDAMHVEVNKGYYSRMFAPLDFLQRCMSLF
jgi:hypothetical protein